MGGGRIDGFEQDRPWETRHDEKELGLIGEMRRTKQHDENGTQCLSKSQPLEHDVARELAQVQRRRQRYGNCISKLRASLCGARLAAPSKPDPTAAASHAVLDRKHEEERRRRP
jgi:hypothetical protein